MIKTPMKKFLFIMLAAFMTLQASAQVRFGLKAGLTTSDFNTQDYEVFRPNSFETIKLGVQNANYGFHFGGFLQIKTGFLFLQPELLLNSSSIDYRITDFSEGPAFTRIVTETYNSVDVPVLVGFKLGPMRFGVGPVAKVHLNNTKGISDIQGISEDFKAVALGYQAGVGLNLWHITLDLRVENSLTKFGDQISVFGQSVPFDDRQKQVSFSIGYRF